jgi:hypothetical protein
MTSEREFEHLTNLVYAAAVRDAGWQECVRDVGRALGADRIGLFRHDLMSGTGAIEHAIGISTDISIQLCCALCTHKYLVSRQC